MADEAGISPAEMFEDDARYEELVRTTFEPEEYARKWYRSTAELDEALLLESAVRGILIQEEMVSITGDQLPAVNVADVRERVKKVRKDTAAMERLRGVLDSLRKASGDSLFEELSRFYGEKHASRLVASGGKKKKKK